MSFVITGITLKSPIRFYEFKILGRRGIPIKYGKRINILINIIESNS